MLHTVVNRFEGVGISLDWDILITMLLMFGFEAVAVISFFPPWKSRRVIHVHWKTLRWKSRLGWFCVAIFLVLMFRLSVMLEVDQTLRHNDSYVFAGARQ